MKHLRIAFLSGGRFVHVRPYIDFFRDKGHDVHWIKCDQSDENYGVSAYDLSAGARGDKAWSKWKYLLAGVRISKVLHHIKPDVLHGHYATSAGVIGLMSGFKPLVLTAHGSDVSVAMRSRLWRAILRRVFARADLVNPVSDELAAYLEQLRVPKQKIFVSTLGVDTSRFIFQPRQPRGGIWRLVCTRTLAEVYDPLTVLSACEILKGMGLRFEMSFVAGGRMLEFLKSESARLGVSHCVTFLGGVDNASLPSLLRSHDIYISASTRDGTSISLLEAMAVGVFPVVSHISANTAVLSNGGVGELFQCGNAEQLARGVWRATCDDEYRRSAIEANRCRVMEVGDRMKNMHALERRYYDLLDYGTQ